MDDRLFTGKGIHLFHLNIRSLLCKHKFDMFKEQMVNSKAYILCLSETCLKKSVTSNIINIPVYRLTCLDRDWEVNIFLFNLVFTLENTKQDRNIRSVFHLRPALGYSINLDMF